MLPHEHVCPTSYYLPKDRWFRTQETPYVGLVRHLDKHILEYAKRRILAAIVDQKIPTIQMARDNNIGQTLLNEYGKTPQSHTNKIIMPYQILSMTIYGPRLKTTLL
jgi:hypothetical protein